MQIKTREIQSEQKETGLAERVVKEWPRLPRESVVSPSLEMFQPHGPGQPPPADPARAGRLDRVIP